MLIFFQSQDVRKEKQVGGGIEMWKKVYYRGVTVAKN